MHSSGKLGARHATGKSTEWGKKARKAEATLYRHSARTNAIAAGLADCEEDQD